MIKRFIPIVDAIRSRSEKELGFDASDVTSRALSTLTGNLRAFVETTLGKNARKPPPNTTHITKFPDKLFSDYRPDGALYIMLCACLNYKCLLGVRRLEFQNPDKASHLFDLLVRIEKDLSNANMLPVVKVHFSRSLSSSCLPELRTIIQKRGSIVSSASAATHIIYNDPKDTTAAETAGTDYCRPLKFSDTHAFVHWWYYPDSYDSWIPRGDVDDVIEPAEEHQGPWHVQMRWLHDTELYNEWMNEADYEVPSSMRGKSNTPSKLDSAKVSSRSETVRNSYTPPTRTHSDRSSKKRKRSSQRDSDKPVTKDVDNNDEMDLGDSPGDSEAEASKLLRNRRGATEGSARDRKSRDSRRDSITEKSHPRKKARISDEKKKSTTTKVEPSTSVKVRLYLKPPSDSSKERNRDKDKKRDSKLKDSSRGEGKSRDRSRSDSRMKDVKNDGMSREPSKAKEGSKELSRGKESFKSKESSRHKDKIKYDAKTEDSYQGTNSEKDDSRRGKEALVDEKKVRDSVRSESREKDMSKSESLGSTTPKDITPKSDKKDKRVVSPKNALSVDQKIVNSAPKVRIKLGGKVTEANPQTQLSEPPTETTRDHKPETPLHNEEHEKSAAHSSAGISHSSDKPSDSEDAKIVTDDISPSPKLSPKRQDAPIAGLNSKVVDVKNEVGVPAEKDLITAGETVQEQKKPFSRRKRSRKERNQQNRAPGLTVVEDAIPISEGDVPRIRNISHDGTDPDTATDAPALMNIDSEMNSASVQVNGAQPMELDNDDVNEGQNAQSSVANGTINEAGDHAPIQERVTAVAEKSVSGFVANAPASGADLVESIPPITVRMPAHSRWFRMDSIHDIEKRALPEFFDRRSQSKTPTVYKKYRDFMIEVWRQSSEKYLTATAVRRHLAGDVCAILRVFMFLERWGLINYGVEPEGKPFLNSALKSRGVRPKPVVLDGQTTNDGNGVPRLFFFDEPKPPRRDNAPVPLRKAILSAREKSVQEKRAMLSKRELYATAAATKHECDGCGKDCSRMRYHCVANVDMELCPDCFANGRFPPTLSARDFEQLTTILSSEAYDGSVWSEGEVLLLLEGLEKFGDDWNKVAEHVGSKSKEQCVLQFLKMPIEDSFLGDQFGKWNVEHGVSGDVDITQEGEPDGESKFAGPNLPFADASNPVMGQVAFLASCVSPEVASAAAQAALSALLRESGEKISDGTESKSEQAKALLRSPEKGQPGSAAGGNGTAEGSLADAKSKLAMLTTKELDSVAVEAAASVGLAAAVVKGRQLADAETREMERFFAAAVETKMKIVDLKMQEFERLEQHLRRERDRLEKQRMSLYAARIDATTSAPPHSLYLRVDQQTSVAGQILGTQLPQPFNSTGASGPPGFTAAPNMGATGGNPMSTQMVGEMLKAGSALPVGQMVRGIGSAARTGIVGGVPPMAGIPLTGPSSMVGMGGQPHMSRDGAVGTQNAMIGVRQSNISPAPHGVVPQVPGGFAGQVQSTPDPNARE